MIPAWTQRCGLQRARNSCRTCPSIFEADFDDGAYGYRPGRSASGAIQEVHRLICRGYTDVVDVDLSKYFDTIPHAEDRGGGSEPSSVSCFLGLPVYGI